MPNFTRILLGVACLSTLRATVGRGDDAAVPQSLRAEQPWQNERACGANCLYLLMRHHGLPVDQGRLVAEISPSASGNTLYELKSHAKTHGLSVSVFKTSDAGLHRIVFPAIAHLASTQGIDHYVLLCRVDKSTVSVVDGTTLQPLVVAKNQFLRNWSGYVVGRSRPNLAGFGYALGVSVALALTAGIGVHLFRKRKGQIGKSR